MKKTLLVTALLVVSYNLFAFTTQGVWRWRKDDGSETTATWKADQNTPITIYSTDSTIRLRVELYNDINNNSSNSGGFLDGARFEDSISGVMGWDTIKLAANSNAFQFTGTSPFVTDLEATTYQLSGQTIPPYSFAAGKIIIATDGLPHQSLGTSQTSEFEYAIKPTANIQPGVTYYFRVDAANYPDGYIFPSLTTASILPVNITSFNVQPNKNSVLIKWTTATETNNSHFDIERSNDGKIYSKIATVQGNGTTSQSHTYQAFDDKPLNGINYYHIKQVDADGKYQVSDVRFLKMALQNYVLNVFPNPAHSNISFSLNNYNGTAVTATLHNASGKTVHEEVIQLNGAGNYKLNLQSKLSPGVYFLQLTGDALSENSKVVVQ
ncbi:MAG: T9SS type A sorting domain-containing protein [Parafilimonas sp.]